MQWKKRENKYKYCHCTVLSDNNLQDISFPTVKPSKHKHLSNVFTIRFQITFIKIFWDASTSDQQ